MDVLYPRCAGLDVHKDTVLAGVRVAGDGATKTEVRTSCLQARLQRLRHRRGPKRAICAVAASILTAAYHMLRGGTFYQDLGADHFRRARGSSQPSRPPDRKTRLHLHNPARGRNGGFFLGCRDAID